MNIKEYKEIKFSVGRISIAVHFREGILEVHPQLWLELLIIEVRHAQRLCRDGESNKNPPTPEKAKWSALRRRQRDQTREERKRKKEEREKREKIIPPTGQRKVATTINHKTGELLEATKVEALYKYAPGYTVVHRTPPATPTTKNEMNRGDSSTKPCMGIHDNGEGCSW